MRRVHMGFTLMEVLVALSIMAIALMAGLRAAGVLTHNAQRQGEMLLAQICAENEFTKIRLARNMPGIGQSSVTCEQAGRMYTVSLRVSATPNPSFRRVDAHVSDASGGLLHLTMLASSF